MCEKREQQKKTHMSISSLLGFAIADASANFDYHEKNLSSKVVGYGKEGKVRMSFRPTKGCLLHICTYASAVMAFSTHHGLVIFFFGISQDPAEMSVATV